MGSSINELPNKQQKDDTDMQKARVKLFQPRSARRARKGVLNLFFFAFVIFVFFVEEVSKPHLRPNGCVAGLRQMLTYSCMLRFPVRPDALPLDLI
jgi:hypothetical protein